MAGEGGVGMVFVFLRGGVPGVLPGLEGVLSKFEGTEKSEFILGIDGHAPGWIGSGCCWSMPSARMGKGVACRSG